MSTTSTVRPAVRAAFDDLIDYAGLFPPARLDMSAALREYLAARGGGASWMLGRFIVPLGRVAEARDAARSLGAQTLSLSLIVDAARDARQWFEAVRAGVDSVARLRETAHDVRVAAIEVPLAPLQSARETFDAGIGQLGALLDRAKLRDLPAYVELPPDAWRRELLDGAMTALARARLSAKLRCGGVSAEAFPPVSDVASFLRAASREGVAFKATAGLHHPVRHRDAATGFAMHGFLNLLAGAAFADRVAPETLERIVAEEDARAFAFDGDAFAWRELRATVDDLRAMRASSFTGYGSCSFAEPVADLTALGVLPAATVAPT
jgi:hypothetical protein